MTTLDAVRHRLHLEPHPEGGYYREIYRSEVTVPTAFGSRAASTAIYFALGATDVSRFHRLRNDELRMWQAGGSATIHIIDDHGHYRTIAIGPDADLTVLIPANVWFGATVDSTVDTTTVDDAFILITAVVAPGFDFADFELGDLSSMLERYPEHQDIIQRLLPNI